MDSVELNTHLEVDGQFEVGFENAIEELGRTGDHRDSGASGSFSVLISSVDKLLEEMFRETQGREVDLLK